MQLLKEPTLNVNCKHFCIEMEKRFAEIGQSYMSTTKC